MVQNQSEIEEKHYQITLIDNSDAPKYCAPIASKRGPAAGGEALKIRRGFASSNAFARRVEHTGVPV